MNTPPLPPIPPGFPKHALDVISTRFKACVHCHHHWETTNSVGNGPLHVCLARSIKRDLVTGDVLRAHLQRQCHDERAGVGGDFCGHTAAHFALHVRHLPKPDPE